MHIESFRKKYFHTPGIRRGLSYYLRMNKIPARPLDTDGRAAQVNANTLTEVEQMSQLIACKSRDGVVLAADGKAVDVDANGNLIELKVERLHQLTDYAAILNGGAVAGESMCQTLKRFVDDENLRYVDDIQKAALPFLATQYERFMRKTCQIHPIDPIHQVTFILGGYTRQDPLRPFRLYLLWTKRKQPLLDSDEISTSFSVPRIIKLEHRLHHLVQQDQAVDRIITVVRSELERLAEVDEEVSEPLSYAHISQDGFKRL